MTIQIPSRRSFRTNRLFWAAFAAASMAILGAFTVDHANYGLAIAGALFVVGMTTFSPVSLPILAFPMLIIVERVGGGGVNLSVSDFMLFAALWPALFLGPRPFSKPMRTILWLSAFYQASTLFAVIANPFYLANIVEWFHAWLLISGALVIGWAVGRSGLANLGISLLMGSFLILAMLTLIQAAIQFPSVGLQPVYLNFPYFMHKNFLGCTLAFGVVLAYSRPVWLRWPPMWSNIGFLLCAAGVAASQSRQAIVSIAVAVIIIALRPDPDRHRSKWPLWLAVPAIFFVITVFQDQLASDNTFNSTYQRFNWYQQTLDIWQTQPLFGVGLRWWYSGRFLTGADTFQPPNAELEVLSSAGIIGLAGFVVMFAGILAVLWRINPRYGTLAFVIVLTRLVQGQFDLFWIAVHVPIPMAIAGVCLGVMAQVDARARSKSGRHRPEPKSTDQPSKSRSKQLVRLGHR